MVGFSGTRESGAGVLMAPNPRESRTVLPHPFSPAAVRRRRRARAARDGTTATVLAAPRRVAAWIPGTSSPTSAAVWVPRTPPPTSTTPTRTPGSARPSTTRPSRTEPAALPPLDDDAADALLDRYLAVEADLATRWPESILEPTLDRDPRRGRPARRPADRHPGHPPRRHQRQDVDLAHGRVAAARRSACAPACSPARTCTRCASGSASTASRSTSSASSRIHDRHRAVPRARRPPQRRGGRPAAVVLRGAHGDGVRHVRRRPGRRRGRRDRAWAAPGTPRTWPTARSRSCCRSTSTTPSTSAPTSRRSPARRPGSSRTAPRSCSPTRRSRPPRCCCAAASRWTRPWRARASSSACCSARPPSAGRC